MFITPNRSQVRNGEKLILNIQPPADRRLISGVRVATERLVDDEGETYFTAYLTQLNIADIQEEHGLGEAFTLEVDTLFYEAGTYFFYSFPLGDAQTVWCEVEIISHDPSLLEQISNAFVTGNDTFRIFNSKGKEIHPNPAIHPLPVLKTDAYYFLAINLTALSAMAPQVSVDFMDESGTERLFAEMLSIYTFPTISRTQDISFSEACEGVDMRSYRALTPIHIFPFRTPDHLSYYEYDGVLRFGLEVKTNPNCTSQLLQIDAFLDDGPALAPIPSYQDFIRENYPNDPSRLFRFPLDRRTFRIVRIGNYVLTDMEELTDIGKALSKGFFYGTKGYFQFQFQGATHIDWESDQQLSERIRTWYADVPKTPGMPYLDWEDPRQRHLIFMLYAQSDHHRYTGIIRQLYPPHSEGEDLTIYLADESENLGNAMGDDGFIVKILRLFHWNNFFTENEEGIRTYHLDTGLFFPDQEEVSFDVFWEDYLETRFLSSYLNTCIHEAGHVYWKSGIGLSFGDAQDKRIPFFSRPAMIDRSLGYFTRNEYMSYGRDRNAGLIYTYGDEILAKVTKRYQAPEISIEVTSNHPRNPYKAYYNIPLGETFSFFLKGKANSGIRRLGYSLQRTSGLDTPLDGNLQGSVQLYDPLAGRVFEDEIPISLMLPEKGIYTYRLEIVDMLDPIPGHQHTDVMLLTLIVG